MSVDASVPARKRELLLLALLALFIGFFVTAELLGAKLWSFTFFGLTPAGLGLSDDAHFVATTGILAFPLTFILTDILNEYFGRRVVRVFTLLGIGVNVVLQSVVWTAIQTPTVSFDPAVSSAEMHRAYSLALGQTPFIVAGSLVAFLIAQFTDAYVFTALRRRTGGRLLWLRSQGSTVVSQLIDTFIVIYLAFVILPAVAGQPAWTLGSAFLVSSTNYVYKFLIAVGITPLLYLVHAGVERYLGRETAQQLKQVAHPTDPV